MSEVPNNLLGAVKAATQVLLAPLKYLRTKNDIKRHWDWTIPALVTVLGVLLLTQPSKPLNVFGEKGLISGVNQLLQVLVGFYIAALAAVASLNNQSLDAPVANTPVTLGTKSLTRRQLLSLMFSYMTLLSITIYACGLGAMLVALPLRNAMPEVAVPWARGFFAAFFVLFLTQLACITLVTLYYLGDRIHVKEVKAKRPVPKAQPVTNEQRDKNSVG